MTWQRRRNHARASWEGFAPSTEPEQALRVYDRDVLYTINISNAGFPTDPEIQIQQAIEAKKLDPNHCSEWGQTLGEWSVAHHD